MDGSNLLPNIKWEIHNTNATKNQAGLMMTNRELRLVDSGSYN